MKKYATDYKDKSRQINEMFICLSFCQTNQTLCAGTNIGRLYFWLKKPKKDDYTENPEDMWELSNINDVCGTIKQLMWGSVNLRLPLLSVNCVTKVYIMKEQNLCTSYCDKVWAIQKNANQILIQNEESEYLLSLDMQVSKCHVKFVNI